MTDTTTASPTLTPTTDARNRSERLAAPFPQPADANSARRERVEALQRRRSSASHATTEVTSPVSVRKDRSRAAQGSKIAAAGFGFASMLGLVAAMGYASRTPSASSQPVAAVPAVPAQVTVVIHPATRTRPASPDGARGAVPTAPALPVVLNAQPIVRQAPAAQATVRQAPVAQAPIAQAPVAQAPVAQAPVAQAPVAQTNGSR